MRCEDGFLGRPCGKTRSCVTCRATWSRSWSWVLREGLSLVKGPTRMVTLTAPGKDVLPWDESVCAWRGDHVHSGPAGCRVDLGTAAVWARDLSTRYHRLLMAARQRAGVHEPVTCARAWEMQERGAPHVHMVNVANPVGERFTEALIEMAPLYGFGVVNDRGYATVGAYAHAAYLGKYVTKGSGARGEMARRELFAYAAALMPRQAVWVSSLLTRRSGATMQTARLLRSLWAFSEGYRELPPQYPDGVVTAWVFYWRRVARASADGLPRSVIGRSVVVRDYGSYEAWDTFSWPGEVWGAHDLAAAA